MARRTVDYTVDEPGRDKGKTFRITEMSASRAEEWATKAILALMANKAELPAGFEKAGMAGLAEIGMKMLAGLQYEVAKPLLAEMMTCVEAVSSKNIVRKLIEEDIEEVKTRILLRAEVWKLHTDFLKAAAQSE